MALLKGCEMKGEERRKWRNINIAENGSESVSKAA